jgi:hypothetical protein
MKHTIKSLSIITLAALLLCSSGSDATEHRGTISIHDVPFGTIFLLPGDSKSIEFEYDGLLWESAAYNIFVISAAISDNQIHKLSVNLTPRGDMGTDIGYFTAGSFIFGKDGFFKFLGFLEPRFAYGSEPVSYIIDAYPAISIGILFSAVVVEYAYFDFPFKMTLTVTLSN